MKFFWHKIEPKKKKKNRLRVVTFNVHFAEKPEKTAQALKNNSVLKQADIFLLQEIEQHEHEPISRAEVIAHALKMNFVYAPARKLHTHGNRGTHGLAILSRYKLTDVEIIKLPFYDLLFRSRPRIAMAGTVHVGGNKIRICNIHLDTTLNFKYRIEQIGGVVQKLLQNPEQKIILGGDFNTIPMATVGNKLPVFYSNQKKKLHQYLELQGFTTSTEKIGYTLRRGLVGFQLDGIYSKNLPIVGCGVERSVKVSDHKPLWIDIRM